jgi:histidinol-phosphate aminotransferase
MNTPYIARHVAALAAYTPGEQPRESGIIKLNTNENPYPPSPRVAAALAAFDLARLRLYPDPMCRKLRESIAVLHGCSVDNIFVGNGSDEILALTTRAFVENDGSIGWFVPSYSLYPVLAEIRDVAARPVELAPGFAWAMPAGYRASLFLMTNPNAPTSLLFEKRQVAAFCRAFPGVVLIDEAYVDFSREHAMDLATAADNTNTLVMRTLSKAYSLAGLRLGYTVGPAPLIAALYKIKDSYNVDMLAQLIAQAALEDPAHMRAHAARIRQTRARLTSALRGRGYGVLDSETNFVFARPPDGRAAELLAQLRRNRILVRHFPGPRTGEYLRITVGTDAEIDALLAALAG